MTALPPSIALFDQPLRARLVLTGERVIVLGVNCNDTHETSYLIAHNEAESDMRGMTTYEPMELIRFEHFFWPEIDPANEEEEHTQDPAGVAW